MTLQATPWITQFIQHCLLSTTAKPRVNILNKGVILRHQMPHMCKALLFYPSSAQASHGIYLQEILQVGVQNELEGLVPHGVDIVVEVLGSLPAVRGSGDEQLHVGIWSVNCGAQHRSGKGKLQLGLEKSVQFLWNHRSPHGKGQKDVQLFKLHKCNDKNNATIPTISPKKTLEF